MKVALEKVERELAKMWEEEAKKTQTSRVALLTLVALVSETRLLPRASEVLSKVVAKHPSRTIAAVWDPGEKPSIDCDVMLHRNAARKDEPCGDAIVLRTYGDARDWLPENIDRLTLAGLPACLWWVGDLPDHDDLFDRMVRLADVVLVNSAEMDLRDLEKLSHIAQASKKNNYALLDLTWIRLRGLQDLVARFFDDPATRPYLDRLKKITISYSPRPNESDVASTRVGLFLGWLATTLGLEFDSARWNRDSKGGDLTVNRAGAIVAVRVDQERKEGVHDGAITRIQLVCDGPDGEGKFEISRTDPLLVRWSCDAPNVVIPHQSLRIGSHEESQLMSRQLERPMRDPLFEASLLAGYRLVRSVAPRLSERPPSL